MLRKNNSHIFGGSLFVSGLTLILGVAAHLAYKKVMEIRDWIMVMVG